MHFSPYSQHGEWSYVEHGNRGPCNHLRFVWVYPRYARLCPSAIFTHYPSFNYELVRRVNKSLGVSSLHRRFPAALVPFHNRGSILSPETVRAYHIDVQRIIRKRMSALHARLKTSPQAHNSRSNRIESSVAYNAEKTKSCSPWC